MLPFNKEQIKIELLVYVVRGKHIFHDTASKSRPDKHESLMFCRKKTYSVGVEATNKRAGYGEPYEFRLAWLTIIQEQKIKSSSSSKEEIAGRLVVLKKRMNKLLQQFKG